MVKIFISHFVVKNTGYGKMPYKNYRSVTLPKAVVDEVEEYLKKDKGKLEREGVRKISHLLEKAWVEYKERHPIIPYPVCPLCEDPLSHTVEIDRETGEIIIKFFCEGAGEDRFEWEIRTKTTNEDLKKLTKKDIGKMKEKKMTTVLIDLTSEDDL